MKISGVAAHLGLHRAVMFPDESIGTPAAQWCDHRNHDTLDCRKQNLRIASVKENNRHRGKQRGKNPFKGVHPRESGRRFQVMIYADGKHHHIGMFGDAEVAARAYDKAAIHYHGEFARLNFPTPA